LYIIPSFTLCDLRCNEYLSQYFLHFFEESVEGISLTSHTCRRSFCTNEFLAGTPVELIMKISGHKSLKDFYRYIGVTPDQAAYQIEKIWKEREQVSAGRA